MVLQFYSKWLWFFAGEDLAFGPKDHQIAIGILPDLKSKRKPGEMMRFGLWLRIGWSLPRRLWWMNDPGEVRLWNGTVAYSADWTGRHWSSVGRCDGYVSFAGSWKFGPVFYKRINV